HVRPPHELCSCLRADPAWPARRLKPGSIGSRTCTMTRRPSPLPASLSADKLAMLRPLRPARNLTEEVVARITEEIRKGRLGPGARLPNEQELMRAMGVSRTVVREAV